MLSSFCFLTEGCELSEPVLDRVERALPRAARDLGPPKRVFAKRFVAPIWSEPNPDAPKLGYLRAGALVRSTTTLPVGTEGCEGGWYELSEVRGFVCAGRDVTIFSGAKLHVLEPGFYVSLDRTFERDGVIYWRTQQNGFVPEAALRRRAASDFRGRALDGRRWTLPIAVTRGGPTVVYRVNGRGKLRPTRERLPARTWLPVHARRRVADGLFLVVGEDHLVRESDVRVIAPTAPPPEVRDGERWIEVDLEQQSLVAYEWLEPRYVTLISSGRLRTPSPDLDYRTPRGLFRIRAKHLTATMDDDEPGEPPYSLEDVPYVMYFEGAYAFHTAFWHDRFGRPRSHGCINMAPHDAKWLFEWAGPDIPTHWHGGYANEENPGTWVWVHGQTPD